MLLFSTILDIKKAMGKDEFINSIIEWNKGSSDPDDIISGIEWIGDENTRFGKDSLWLEISYYKCRNIMAVRCEKTGSDGIVWDSDYIMNFDDMKLCIQLDRSYKEDTVFDDSDFSTPHYIAELIDKDYIENDEMLEVSDEPVLINESNIEIITDLINGDIRYKLPVIYVSKTIFNTDPVDVNHLARCLKGIAHVLVQENRASNAKCRRMCYDNNEFNGAVGIYYPNPAILRKRYLYRTYNGSSGVLTGKIISTILRYSSSQNIEKLYTWYGVSNAMLSDTLNRQIEKRLAAEAARHSAEKARKSAEKARKSAEDEKEMVYESFDDELKKLKAQVDELSRHNDILRYENQGLREKVNSFSSVPVIYMGDEDELFSGEIKEIVISSLDEVLKKTEQKTRRWDVLNDIVINNEFKNTIEDKQKTVKRLFRGYECVSAMMRQELAAIGLELKEEGKHYKIVYYGDDRYWTTISKTPSDARSGRNIAHTIIKTML